MRFAYLAIKHCPPSPLKSAKRRCVSLRQAAHAQPVDRLAVDSALCTPIWDPLSSAPYCWSTLSPVWPPLRIWRGKLNRPPARGGRGGGVDRRRDRSSRLGRVDDLPASASPPSGFAGALFCASPGELRGSVRRSRIGFADRHARADWAVKAWSAIRSGRRRSRDASRVACRLRRRTGWLRSAGATAGLLVCSAGAGLAVCVAVY
jgi:hypothetical protein